MDLNNELGRKITAQRQEQLELRREESGAQDLVLEAEQRKQAEIKRLNQPYELTLSLLARRGYEPFSASPTSQNRRSEVKISESFRLRPTNIDVDGLEKTASLDLKIKATLRDPNPGYGDIPGPFKLFIVMHVPGEQATEHYLTDIGKPILKPNGIPENYGMRTYRVGKKDAYEVDSSVPRDDEADLIASAIKEAAELEGIYSPYANTGSELAT